MLVYPTRPSNRASRLLRMLSSSTSNLATSFLAASRSAGSPAYSSTSFSRRSTFCLRAFKAVCCSSISTMASAELTFLDAGVGAVLAWDFSSEDSLSSYSRILARMCFVWRVCSVVWRCREGGAEKAGFDCRWLSWTRSSDCWVSRYVCSVCMCAMLFASVCEADVCATRACASVSGSGLGVSRATAVAARARKASWPSGVR